MARRSRDPVQLPKSASGFRLCRHRVAGGCTNFCQYRLFTKIVVLAVLVLATVCTAVAMGAFDGERRVRDAAVGVGLFLVLVIPLIVVANRRDPD